MRALRRFVPILALLAVTVGNPLDADGEELDLYEAHPSYRLPGTNGFHTVEFAEERSVWVANDMLYFDVPDGLFPPGQPIYLRVEYLDVDYGYLQVQYDSDYEISEGGRFRYSEIHTRSSRMDSGEFVFSYHVLENPRFANGQYNSSDFRLLLADNNRVPFQVASMTLSPTPFSEKGIQYALSRPWRQPYAGRVKDYTDPLTLVGKVMTGYQGWFGVPNDLSDRGWFHWGRKAGSDLDPKNITIDMWPWINEYREDQIYPAGEMTLKDGRPAYLFSSSDSDTVLRHFRWMRTHGIDGVYLQRFVTRYTSGHYGASEFVLDNVRKAANQEGRVWAIGYDISSLVGDPNPFQVITDDWNWLVEEASILEDERYVHEDGKPVLFIWGFSVPGRERLSRDEADAIVDWFVQKNLYLIAGVPSSWEENTDWHEHYRKYDQLLGWMVTNGSNLNRQKKLLDSWDMKILPHAWPGFSWHHLKQLTPDAEYTPRDGGDFYWTRLYNAVNCGADQIYLGMFDEYDEATAIMPMSDNPPLPHDEWGKYIDNEGRDPFWYLRLSGAANEMLNGLRALSKTMPDESAVLPAAYGGEGVTVYLGASDVEVGLIHRQPEGGVTQGIVMGGHDCRINEAGGYFYFDIDDGYCFGKGLGQAATIEIEFYDHSPGAVLLLEYDGLGGVHSQHPISVDLPDTGNWKRIRWDISDGFFSNRQSEASDFRIAINSGNVVAIRRASVFLPEEEDRENLANVPQLKFDGLNLSWPIVSDAVGWRLIESDNLRQDNWQEVTEPLILENGEIRYEIPTSNVPKFYRLKRSAKK